MAFKTLCTHLIIYILVYSSVSVRAECDCDFSDSLDFSGDTMEFLGLESESSIENITTNHNHYNNDKNNNNNNNSPQQKSMDLHALVLDLARKNKKLSRKVANFPKIIARLYRNVAASKTPQLPMMPQTYPQDKIIFVKPNNKDDSSKSSSSESKSSSDIESVSSKSNSSKSKNKSERRRVTRRRKTKSARKSASSDKTTLSNRHQSQRSYSQARPSRKPPNYRVTPQDRHVTSNYKATSTDLIENNIDPRHLYQTNAAVDEDYIRLPRRSQRVDRSRGFNSHVPNLWNQKYWSNKEKRTRGKLKSRHKERKFRSGKSSAHLTAQTSGHRYSY